MKKRRLILSAVAAAFVCLAPPAASEAVDEARAVALSHLLEEVKGLMVAGPWSVTDNDKLPPSGDPHDFLSFGPYWWPDPHEPDGLPYVRRDGERNPESSLGSDAEGFRRTADAALRLALAHRLGGDPAHAERAGLLLRHFFLDPRTRMNPHLRYGQAIPGRTEGRGIGIISTRHVIEAIEAAELLVGAAGWAAEDTEGFRSWCEAYLDWLLTSPHGNSEARVPNNHGSWYDAQVVALAIHVGREDLAREILKKVHRARVHPQIAAEGSQHHELARTRSWHYSVFNLEALCVLADLGRRMGVDIWHAAPPRAFADSGDTPLLKRAIDFLIPHLDAGTPWLHPEMGELDRGSLVPILLRGQRAYAGYEPALARPLAADRLVVLRHAAEESRGGGGR